MNFAKHIFLFLITLFCTCSMLGQVHLFKGDSRFQSDIICTIYNNHIYRGNSTFNSDIMFTYDAKAIYVGTSTAFKSNLVYYNDGYYIYNASHYKLGCYTNNKVYKGGTFDSNIICRRSGTSVYYRNSTFRSHIIFNSDKPISLWLIAALVIEYF